MRRTNGYRARLLPISLALALLILPLVSLSAQRSARSAFTPERTSMPADTAESADSVFFPLKLSPTLAVGALGLSSAYFVTELRRIPADSVNVRTGIGGSAALLISQLSGCYLGARLVSAPRSTGCRSWVRRYWPVLLGVPAVFLVNSNDKFVKFAAFTSLSSAACTTLAAGLSG